MRRTFSRGNVLYSGYLFKEEQTSSFFGGRSLEKRRRFFILPRVRSTDTSTKLRLSYYVAPGAEVEKGCLFITPKSYVNDMPDVINTIAAASYGMLLYPNAQSSDPAHLWADTWEERELWKTAITEGISLLAQKERVLRRDTRKKRKKKRSDPNNNYLNQSNKEYSNTSTTSTRQSSRSDAKKQPNNPNSNNSGSNEQVNGIDVDITAITRTMVQEGSDYLNIRSAVQIALAPNPLLEKHKQLIRQTIDLLRTNRAPSPPPPSFLSPSSQNKANSSSASSSSTSLGVSSLASELKSSILTRFSTESRGSSVGFDINNPADRCCLLYLRSISFVSTEHTNITTVLHPLLNQLYHDIKRDVQRSILLGSPSTSTTATSSTSSTASTPASKSTSTELKYIRQFEQDYYTSTMMIRSHRQNVMLSLKPKLRRFVIRTEQFLSNGNGELQSSSFSSSIKDTSFATIKTQTQTQTHQIHQTHQQQKQRALRRGQALLEDPMEILQAGGCPPGVLHVTVVRGHNLRETQRLTRQDPYVTLQCSGMRQYQRTKYIRSGGNAPEWTSTDDSTFSLPVQGSMDVVRYPESCHLEVWNENTLTNSLIGTADVDVLQFAQRPKSSAWHWQGLVGGDGKGNHGKVLLRVQFIPLKKNRILNSKGVALRKIGDLHVGLPQTKLHLLLPKSRGGMTSTTKKNGKDDAINKGKTKSSTRTTVAGAVAGTAGTAGTAATLASESAVPTDRNREGTHNLDNGTPEVTSSTPVLSPSSSSGLASSSDSEHRYVVRVRVEAYELSTEPIVIGDMEADGTLSFRSWELNRDGRQRLHLPLAITDPFATILFDVVNISPDTQDEKILGEASTSILRLIEKQTTALMERENQEEHHFNQSGSTGASSLGAPTKKVSGIYPKGQSIVAISESLKQSFQKQVVLASGRGAASLRTASALLRGPSSSGLIHGGVASEISSDSASASATATATATSVYMIPPVVLKVKDKRGKEIGVLQLRLHYEEMPSNVFIPRPVAYENHDFSFRRFEMNVARGVRMINTLKSVIAFGKSIFAWEEPMLTGALLCLFIFTCTYAFDYQLAVLPISIGLVVLRQYKHRKSGRYRNEFVVRGLLNKSGGVSGGSGGVSGSNGNNSSNNSSNNSGNGNYDPSRPTLSSSMMPTELRVALIAAKNIRLRNMKSKKINPFAEVHFVTVGKEKKRSQTMNYATHERNSSNLSEDFDSETKLSGNNGKQMQRASKIQRRSVMGRVVESTSNGHNRNSSSSSSNNSNSNSNNNNNNSNNANNNVNNNANNNANNNNNNSTSSNNNNKNNNNGISGPIVNSDNVTGDTLVDAQRNGKIRSSVLVGRTNTEYSTRSPRWGTNEKSLGSNRMHLPGQRTVVERWHDHATAFKALLPHMPEYGMYGIGIGRKKIEKNSNPQQLVVESDVAEEIAEAMLTAVDPKLHSSGSFKWEKQEGKAKNRTNKSMKKRINSKKSNNLLSNYRNESVVVVRVFHEHSEASSNTMDYADYHEQCECLGEAVVPLSSLVGSDGGAKGGDQPIFERWLTLQDSNREPRSITTDNNTTNTTNINTTTTTTTTNNTNTTNSTTTTNTTNTNNTNNTNNTTNTTRTNQSDSRMNMQANNNTHAHQVLVRLQLALPLSTWSTRKAMSERETVRKKMKEERREAKKRRREKRRSSLQSISRDSTFSIDSNVSIFGSPVLSGENIEENTKEHNRSLSPLSPFLGPSNSYQPNVSIDETMNAFSNLPSPSTPTRRTSATKAGGSGSISNNNSSNSSNSNSNSSPSTSTLRTSEWTGYYGKFLKIRRSTRYVQNMIDNVCRTFERIKNLLSWSQPEKTRVVLYVLLCMAFLFLIIPTRHIVLTVGLYLFTERFRKQGTYVKKTWHFINTVPSDVQVDSIYEEERSQFQKRLNRGVEWVGGSSTSKKNKDSGKSRHQSLVALDVKGAKVSLNAVWEGYMQTYGRSRIGRGLQKRNTRYWALQSYGVLQWWLRRELAESGQKPRGELFFSSVGGSGGSMVLPIDRNNEWELELRGFRDRDLTTRLVIVLIARSSPDREGWLHAIQQVMESMER